MLISEIYNPFLNTKKDFIFFSKLMKSDILMHTTS